MRLRYVPLLAALAFTLTVTPARADSADAWMQEYAGNTVELLESISAMVRRDVALTFLEEEGLPVSPEFQKADRAVSRRLQVAVQYRTALVTQWKDGSLSDRTPDHERRLREIEALATKVEAELERASIPILERPEIREVLQQLRFRAGRMAP